MLQHAILDSPSSSCPDFVTLATDVKEFLRTLFSLLTGQVVRTTGQLTMPVSAVRC